MFFSVGKKSDWFRTDGVSVRKFKTLSFEVGPTCVSFGKIRSLRLHLSASGQGVSDTDIASKLNLTELKVQRCTAWLRRNWCR